MTITIEHINEKAMKKVISEMSFRVFQSIEQMEEGLYSCVLNEYAIIKTFSDEILIDLGGEKCFISKEDFFVITIE